MIDIKSMGWRGECSDYWSLNLTIKSQGIYLQDVNALKWFKKKKKESCPWSEHWSIFFLKIEAGSWDYSESLQTKDNSIEVTKAKSNTTSNVGLLYSQGNLIEDARKRIAVVLEIFVMWRRHADTFSPKNISYIVVHHFATPSETAAKMGPRRYLRASHN